MLHGLNSSAELFRKKTGSLRKLNKRLSYTYINAPVAMNSSAAAGEDAPEPVYGWFHHKAKLQGEAVSGAASACGDSACWTCNPVTIDDFDTALAHIKTTVYKVKPAYVVAFSQGATVALAALIADLLDGTQYLVGVRGIVLASPWVPHFCTALAEGSGSNDPQAGNPITDILLRARRESLAAKGLLLPPLHRVLVVCGEADTITPMSGIEFLRTICPQFSYVGHPNGHLIPTGEPVRSALQQVFTTEK